jgi:Phage tail assembly chaperone
MAKLQLVAHPTFSAQVAIPVAGGAPVAVEFIFKHRTKTELDAFIASRADKSNAETLLDMVQGWNLDEPFNAANVDLLLENYIGTAVVAYHAYVDELVKTKLKN